MAIFKSCVMTSSTVEGKTGEGTPEETIEVTVQHPFIRR